MELYRTAIIQDTDSLMLIQDQTLPLCQMAAKKNASALQWVNQELFSREEYGEICFAAFYRKQGWPILDIIFGEPFGVKRIQGYQALRFADKGRLLPGKYREICLLAIQYSGESLPFVDGSLWLDKGFCREALKASKYSRDYVKN
jgi:hypothetical protein